MNFINYFGRILDFGGIFGFWKDIWMDVWILEGFLDFGKIFVFCNTQSFHLKRDKAGILGSEATFQ